MIFRSIDFSHYSRNSISLLDIEFVEYKISLRQDFDITINMNKRIWDLLALRLSRRKVDLDWYIFDTWLMFESEGYSGSGLENEVIDWLIYVATVEAEDRLQGQYGYANDNMRGLPYIFEWPVWMEKNQLKITDLRR